MGAWIETLPLPKLHIILSVAPCMGAWIETPNGCAFQNTTGVAPCMGAWIETHFFRRKSRYL